MFADSDSTPHALGTAWAAVQTALSDLDKVDISWIRQYQTKVGWALSSDALKFLTSLIGHLKPRHILELGSGLSTRVLARACSDLPHKAFVSSVDHDPEFGLPAVKKSFAAEEGTAGCRISLQFAPLVARDCGGKMLPVYHLQSTRLASRHPADLVLIDGPPLVLGGREGTLYQAMDFVRPGSLVLLDDALRKEEQTAISRWQDILGEAIELRMLPGFFKGLAAILVHEKVSGKELWPRRLRLARQELDALVPKENQMVLVGEDWWRAEVASGRQVVPFLERHGKYWGHPQNDVVAIQELERILEIRPTHFVLGWPYFWWFDCYMDFHRHLVSRFRCTFSNDRLMVFDLSS